MDESKDLTYSTNYEYNEKGFLISEIRNRESLNKSNFWDGNKYEYEIVNGVDKLRRIKKLTNPINAVSYTHLTLPTKRIV